MLEKENEVTMTKICIGTRGSALALAQANQIARLLQDEGIAEEVSLLLPKGERELFLQGCGVVPGGIELFETAHVRSKGYFDFLTPIPWLSSVRCPVTVAHSAGDDVIPVEQADRLLDALPRNGLHKKVITGMISHSGRNVLGAGPTFVRELFSMIQIMHATISVSLGRN